MIRIRGAKETFQALLADEPAPAREERRRAAEPPRASSEGPAREELRRAE